MRIIAGKYKGKRILAPSNLPARPTTDFAKEGLFNILNNQVEYEELSVLDLFAGTGNISYEFASRGAKEVIAVDDSFHCTKCIGNNSSAMGVNIKVVKAEVLQFLKRNQQKYDLIFADPPFSYEEYDLLIEHIQQNNLLNKDGIFVLEYAAERDFSTYGGCFDTRKYGAIKFSFFKF